MASAGVAAPSSPTPAKGGKKGAKGAQGAVAFVPKPNEEEFRSREDAAQAKISELQAQMTKLQDEIRGKQGGRDEYSHKKQEIHQRLDKISAEIKTLEVERSSLLDQIQSQQEFSRKNRTQAQTMRKELQFETEEEIDEQLKEMERFMISSSVSLKEEKEMVKKMGELRHMKPIVRDYSQLELEARSSSTTKIVPLKARLEIVRTELNKLKDSRRAEAEKSQQLVEERQKKTAPVQELYDKRSELHRELTEQKKVLMDTRAEKQQQMKEYNDYLGVLRKARKEAEREEQKKRDLETQKNKVLRSIENLEAQEGDLPGMQLLQQTVAYVERLAVSNEAAGDDSPVPAAAPAVSDAKMGDEFGEVLKPKNQREEDFYLAPSKTKGRRAKKTTQKKGRVISHDLHVLSDFAELEVSPPLTPEDAAACLEKLKEKLDALESRRSEFAEANQRKKDQLKTQLAEIEKKERQLLKEEIASLEKAAETSAAAKSGTTSPAATD